MHFCSFSQSPTNAILIRAWTEGLAQRYSLIMNAPVHMDFVGKTVKVKLSLNYSSTGVLQKNINQFRAQLFIGRMNRYPVDKSYQDFLYYVIRWIGIYSVDSVIHPSENWVMFLTFFIF